MCMITYTPENVYPDPERIVNGGRYNDDGHGFALIGEDGHLVVRRGMDLNRLVEEFVDLRQRGRARGPGMFHSRMATHGSLEKSNIHPFYVGNDRQTVIVHNGIFSQLEVPVTSDRSDTRVFAEVVLPKNPRFSLLTRKGRKRVTAWMGRFNKLAVITTNPRATAPGYILNEPAGHWDDGIWYSNSDYHGWPRYTSWTSGYGSQFYRHSSDGDDVVLGSIQDALMLAEKKRHWWDEETTECSGGTQARALEDWRLENRTCEFCQGFGTVDGISGICNICTMCSWCEQYALTCLCK